MHILEQYALGCGVKIKKPYIYSKYYPLPFDKYIVLHAPNKFQSRTYDYWEEVLSIIKPILSNENINIVQIGAKNELTFPNHCYITNGETNFNQISYIIKNSQLLLGIDSFPIHIAGHHNIPIVGLYSNMYKEHSRPYWGNKENQILIESHRNNLKPSYVAFEKEKTINLIKPEEIATAVLKLLKIKTKVNVKSLFFGEMYKNQIVEMIPSNPVDISGINIPHINVRMDVEFNLETLQQQLNMSKVSIITDKEIPLDLIAFYKQNIVRFTFFVNENLDHKFLEKFITLGIPFDLVTKEDEEVINNLKIKYMDLGLIVPIKYNFKDKLKEIINKPNLKFRSNKKTLYRGRIYPTIYHAFNNLPYISNDFSEQDFNFIKDISDEDLSFAYIYQEST